MLILTFLSTHHALAAESLLRQQQINYELLPTPRAITAHCGLSLRLERSDFWRVQAMLGDNAGLAAIYTREDEHGDYKELTTKE